MDVEAVDHLPVTFAAPRDQRLAGKGMQGIRRPGGEPLVSDGIVGVEGVDLNLPRRELLVLEALLVMLVHGAALDSGTGIAVMLLMALVAMLLWWPREEKTGATGS